MSRETPDYNGGVQYGAQRILGVYPQRQAGLFMQRIRVLGGRITWPQWRKAVELARRYSLRSTLHITTRQDIELHDIAEQHLGNIQRELIDAGMKISGACGDCIRNITVCSGCPFDSNSGGTYAAAQLIYEHLADYSCDLPRKFKISFSGCSFACAKPWISDMGFIKQQDELYTAIGAGSLGPKPATGIELYKDVIAKDILPLCLAALEFFNEFGDRKNRSRARFRHVREKLGDEQFKSELAVRFDRLRSSRDWPDVPANSAKNNLKLLWKLQLPNGNINLDDAVKLADSGEPAGAELRINLEHRLEIYGNETFKLPENLASLENLPVIIACPGLSSCSKALADTWAATDSMRSQLAGKIPSNLRISISGCPNNCAQSAVVDIGLTGLKHGCRQFFRLVTGSYNRTDNDQARNLICAEHVPSVVEELISSADGIYSAKFNSLPDHGT